MTGRERVLRTLQYKETDKVPTTFRAESNITADVMWLYYNPRIGV